MFAPCYVSPHDLTYDLTRKGRQFVWGKEQQNAFEEIK